MKKVLIFSLVYYPKHVGGAEVAIKEITDRIDPSEIEFHLLCLRMDSTLPKMEQIGNVMVHRFGFAKPNPSMADLKRFPLHFNKALFQILAFFWAWKLHRQYRFDGIWGMMAHATGVPSGIFKTFFPNVAYILTLQEGDPPEQIERTMRVFGPLFRRGFMKADVIQAISNFLGAWGKHMGFTGRLEVIPNAVDTKKFSREYPKEELIRAREAMGIEDNDVLLITTSRLVHKNAIDDVIKALPLVPSNVKFVICGIGPDEEQLKAVAKDTEVADRVLFIGQVEHDIMPRYLKAADIFIRPSRSEGMGNSFVEAMAAGIPVVATQEGGIADFLFDAERNPEKPTTGFAVEKNNPHEIAAAVMNIIEHPEMVSKVTAHARSMAFEKYDWNLIAKDMRERVFLPALNQ